jgi:hypothetical protein
MNATTESIGRHLAESGFVAILFSVLSVASLYPSRSLLARHILPRPSNHPKGSSNISMRQ